VASTSFLVIRIIKQILLPEFLAWFINHPDTLQLIKSQAIGSSIVSISKPVLEELEISVPDVKTQEAVLKISRLWEQKSLLEKQIGELREKQLHHLIKKAIQ
jgi:restriction endonuclease S subunit